MADTNKLIQFAYGLQAKYDALGASVNADTIYFCTDSQRIFKGDVEFSRPVKFGSALPDTFLPPNSFFVVEGTNMRTLYYSKDGAAWHKVGHIYDNLSIGTKGDTGATRALAYGDSFKVVQLTVDAHGFVTAASEITLTLPEAVNLEAYAKTADVNAELANKVNTGVSVALTGDVTGTATLTNTGASIAATISNDFAKKSDLADGSVTAKEAEHAATADKATADAAGNNIAETYATKTEVSTADAKKADKVTGAVSGNLAGLDDNGNLTDSGIAASTVGTKAEIKAASDAAGVAKAAADAAQGDATKALEDAAAAAAKGQQGIDNAATAQAAAEAAQGTADGAAAKAAANETAIGNLTTEVGKKAAQTDLAALDERVDGHETRIGNLETAIENVDSAMHFIGSGATLPDSGENGDVYLITSGDDAGKEFVYSNGNWVELGDASDYLLKTDAASTYQTISQHNTDKAALEKAISDAQAAAESHADAAAATAKTEAINAAAEDATTKANKALEDAKADAASKDSALKTELEGKIATAKSEAISAAASDATTKADQAEADAIAAAAEDATTKANAAQAAAISTAAADATSKADAAQAAAIAAAATDATNKADAAQAAANSYTDQKVAAAALTWQEI